VTVAIGEVRGRRSEAEYGVTRVGGEGFAAGSVLNLSMIGSSGNSNNCGRIARCFDGRGQNGRGARGLTSFARGVRFALVASRCAATRFALRAAVKFDIRLQN
jgi:hypothetical protein